MALRPHETGFLLPSGAPSLLDGDELYEIPQLVTRRPRWPRALALTLLTLIALVAAVLGYAYWQATSILGELHAGAKAPLVAAAKTELGSKPAVPLSTRLSSEGIKQNSTPPTAAKAQTILLVGTDARWGETGGRSDTMMLMRILPAQHTISLLSIPRDLRVPIPGYGDQKVNAAYAYGGSKLLIATLRDYLGVSIDHFIEINFRGFSQVVNTLGGVYVSVDQRYYNRNVHTAATDFADIDIQPGYQRLNATDALAYVRFRHMDSDFTRAARQQLFLRETERQVIAAKFDFPKMQALIHAFAAASASDLSSLSQVWQLADAVRKTPPSRAVRLTIPATGEMIGGVDYEIADPAAKDEMVARWYQPGLIVQAQTAATHAAVHARQDATPAKPVLAALVGDNGQAVALVRPLAPTLERCAPTKLPSGFSYPASDAARSYTLAGHPALAFYASEGSGRSLLWMETSWQDPPILVGPSRTVTVAGRSLDLWEESGAVRQVAFRVGNTRVWLTNTLMNVLSPAQMIGLATSCAAVS